MKGTVRSHVVELAISVVGDKEPGAYLLDLDELNPRRYKIIAGSIASLFEHEIKIERDSHVRTAEIRVAIRSRDIAKPHTSSFILFT